MWKSGFCCAFCQNRPSRLRHNRKSSPKPYTGPPGGFFRKATTETGKSLPKPVGLPVLSTPCFSLTRRNPVYSRNYTKFPVSHRKGRSGGNVEKACGFLFSQTHEQVFNTLLRTGVENCETHLSTRQIYRKTLDISSVPPPAQQPLHSISTPQNPISTTC